MKHAQIEREKNQDANDEADPVPGCDYSRVHLRFTIYDLCADCKWIRQSQIANAYTFADAASWIATCEAPMFGRSPLCHHKTNALAM
jgi:hypothetical protein